MMGVFGLFIGLSGQWLLGVFVASFVLSFRRSTKRPFIELAGLGCALGVGTIAWLLFLWSFFGGSLGVLPSGLLTAFGFLTGGPIFVARLREWWVEHTFRSVMSEQANNERAVCVACKGLVAILGIACFVQSLLTPQKLWDERAIFAMKASVLFEDRSIRSPALLHPDFVQYHPRYPLLIPLAEEHLDTLLGRVDDRLSKLIFPLLYCGLVLTTAGVLLRYLSRAQAWFGTLLLATVPVLMPYEYGFLCGQGDAPIACYHGLSVLYLWDALQRLRQGHFDPGPILIAGICGGLAGFTKDEGIAFLIIDSAILCLFAIIAMGRIGCQKTSVESSASLNSASNPIRLQLQSLALFTVAAGTILVPWFVHRRVLPNTTEMNYFGRMTVSLFVSRLDTLGWSVPHLAHRMFWEWREWGLQWWMMVVAIVGWPVRAVRRPSLFLILDIAGALASLLVAGMLAPAQLDEHIGGSSHRFLMQIAPVAVLFAVTQFFHNDDELSSS